MVSPDPFAAQMGNELEGAILSRIRRRGFDRVIEMRWETPAGKRRASILELIGRSANLLLLDEDERVLGFARRIASAFRSPVVGEAYRPPVPRPELEDLTWDLPRCREYLSRFEPGSPPARSAADLLRLLSPALGEDFPSDSEAAEDPVRRLEEILAAVGRGNLEPTLYTSAPPEVILAEPSRFPEPPILSPFPLLRPPRAVATAFLDVETAVRRMGELLDAQRGDRETRERIAGALRREQERQRRLALKLRAELEESDGAEALQRSAEMILAHPEARVEGSIISVPDLYHPEQRTIAVPADPALTPRENAERLFARARKLRRGAGAIRARISVVGSILASLEEREQEFATAVTPRDLEELEKRLEEDDLLSARPARPARRPAPAESLPGIRKYRTEQGFVILVGKTSRDNDRLTFQVAAPHDFWFHAAGRSGAHVVVRNPARLKELPPPVALSAARMAAHFSRARGGGKVEVHYTLRKHVRKGRRFGPGQVSIRNYRTLEVEPGIPGSEEES